LGAADLRAGGAKWPVPAGRIKFTLTGIPGWWRDILLFEIKKRMEHLRYLLYVICALAVERNHQTPTSKKSYDMTA
jgi:hypothetical protein